MRLNVLTSLCLGAFSAAVFHPGEVMMDTNGHRIQAHQPHIFGPHDGVYYWYGSSKVGSVEAGTPGVVNVYTSADLYNWEYGGEAYNETGYAARPSMLGKNPRTGKFVLWAKGGQSFQSAVADSPLGPFHQVGTARPSPETKAGDSASFRDPLSDKAYMTYSQKPKNGYTRAMMIVELDDDWTDLAGSAPVPTVVEGLEAPAPFYSPVSGRYHVWTSHCSGWKPNPAELLVADSMLGTWSKLGNPTHDHDTFGTQGSHVLPLDVVGGTQRLLYMGDRYEPFIDSEEGSRYIFLPMEVAPDGAVTLYNVSTWSIEQWPGASGAVVV